jgi:hypothetical protein
MPAAPPRAANAGRWASRFHIGKALFRHVKSSHVAAQQEFPQRQMRFHIMENVL